MPCIRYLLFVAVIAVGVFFLGSAARALECTNDLDWDEDRAGTGPVLLDRDYTLAELSAFDQDFSQSDFPQPFDLNAQYLRDIFVAPFPTGNDATGDGSANAPFSTIAHALTLYKTQPGTRIRVQSGTYGEIGYFNNIQGTARNPVAVVAEGEVVIEADGSPTGMMFKNSNYVVLQGLTFQNASVYGLNISDGLDGSPTHHVVLRNLKFRDIGSGSNNDCLKMSGVDDFYVTGCEIQGCNEGEAIDMVGCHNGVVTSNYIHDVLRSGVQSKGGSADVFIHGNRFENIPHRAVNAGGSTGARYIRPLDAEYEAARIQVVANTFLRTGTTSVAFVGCDTCVFANNTIIKPQDYVALISEENTSLTAGHDGYFINNLVVFNRSEMKAFVGIIWYDYTRPETYTFGWNLWYALDDPDFSGPVYPSGLPAEVNAIVQQDPLLYDIPGGNYRISTDSPARGYGRDVPRGAVADYDRIPFADPPSIGAFEATSDTDSIAPAAPTALAAIAGDGSVSLDWDDNEESDLASYTLYRNTTSGGGYSSIATDVTTSVYTDSGLENGTEYYYVVTAVDKAGNESSYSIEVFATPSDASEPEVLESEDFENPTPGNWINVTGDDTNDWTRNSDGTPSSRTGPDSGANGTTWYMYVETSRGDAYNAGDTAILEGPEITGSDRRLSFYYHMYGSNMGTLSVDVYDGNSWTNDVWSLSREQHYSSSDAYTQATVDLNSFSGTIKVRFRCTAGGGWRGDIAIDDIEITGLP